MNVKYVLSMLLAVFPLVTNASCKISINNDNELILIVGKEKCLKKPETLKEFNSTVSVTLEKINKDKQKSHHKKKDY